MSSIASPAPTARAAWLVASTNLGGTANGESRTIVDGFGCPSPRRISPVRSPAHARDRRLLTVPTGHPGRSAATS